MRVSVCVHLLYMDEVFISATNDVVVGDGDGVDAASTGLQDMNTLQRSDVPNLTRQKERIGESEKKKKKKEEEEDEFIFG